VIELSPAHRIDVAEQTSGILVPDPPEIACQRLQPFLDGSDETIEGASLAHDRRDLGGSLRQHANLIVPKHPGIDRLNDENALQDSSIDERDIEKGLIRLFSGLTEVFEAWVASYLCQCNRAYLLRDQTGEAFMHTHPKSANTTRAQPERRSQRKVGSVRFEQIRRTNICLEPFGNQRHNVHEGLSRLATLSR
jgi:hypothetical protein